MPKPANSPVPADVQAALRAFDPADLRAHACALLKVLDYTSERTLDLGGSPQALLAEYPPLGAVSRAKSTKSAQYFLEVAKSAHILFQYTEQEISESVQMSLLEDAAFDHSKAKSFLFIAVELAAGEYPRGKYAAMTREISRRFAMPVCVLFENGGRITLAFAHRRESKRRGDMGRDILGKVSLIRDVNCADPHRAHLDILVELAREDRLDWIESNKKQKNFDGLLQAWQAVLDTEELNKRFYRELFAWFEWAVADAKFPKQKNKTVPVEDHVIRLITRILFVWFIKEKKLVAEELFNEAQIAPLLKNYDRAKGDDYYRAILQNLFFATLNTEIDKRRFSKVKQPTHRNFNLFRHKDLLADSTGGALLRLLKKTPFINGGLFDCLDSEESTGDGGYRLDCFSDHPPHRKLLSVPNRLFFADKDDKDGKRGLFPLLNKYKFTVEENTPIEQEVALDPELLGKVFENLLAAYNPETRGTARNQTGSYYTPRAIVDYMVGEVLVASLAKKAAPTSGDAAFFRKRLRHLLNYADAGDAAELFDARARCEFDADERREIVCAIAQLSVLDPAVGSGAFPMSILHKLTLALGRLDPKNEIWRELQTDRAEERNRDAYEYDKKTRDEELLEISKNFENYTGDFGRKLYLIQNSIFGVDIQPVACLIAKLRFFISLAIEQNPNDDSTDNFGIKPLPNLETRFVSADALIGLRVTERSDIPHAEINELEEALRQNRERHFNADNRDKKLACNAADKKLRQKLGKALAKHYRRDADWNVARRMVDAGLETLRRELAKYQIMQRVVSQDTLLPDGREPGPGDWRETIAQLQAEKPTGEKLLAAIRRKDKAVKTHALWTEAAKTAKAEDKLIHAEAQKLSAWDPYDQNATARWFDAEWMFGVVGGFDVVIGNPPYVQLQERVDLHDYKGILGKLYENKGFTTFTRGGDIYQLFYEKGYDLLAENGRLCLITSNKWMRAGYGKLSRKFLADSALHAVVNFGELPVFEAGADPAIVLTQKQKPAQSHCFTAIMIKSADDIHRVGEVVLQHGFDVAMSDLSADGWTLERPAVLALLAKMRHVGKPLGEYVRGQIYYGVKTGYNEAFVIDKVTKEKLIAEDPKSAELIKPWLRGRDIKKWQVGKPEWSVIFSKQGTDIKEYPAIKKHLQKYRLDLEPKTSANQIRGRAPGRYQWHEIQATIGYDEEFKKPKIIYADIAKLFRASYDEAGVFCGNTTHFIPTDKLELLAVLHSRLFDWYSRNTFQGLGDPWRGGRLRYFEQNMRGVPIPEMTDVQKTALVSLTKRILMSPESPATAALEAEIDQLVYQLYQLTTTEIALVEQARAPA